jgi:hypothetical protein
MAALDVYNFKIKLRRSGEKIVTVNKNRDKMFATFYFSYFRYITIVK